MYELRESTINGLGIHLLTDAVARVTVDAVIINYIVTPWFGRWINHSYKPNSYLVENDTGNWDLVTKEAVEASQELTLDYTKLPEWLIPYNKPGADWK